MNTLKRYTVRSTAFGLKALIVALVLTIGFSPLFTQQAAALSGADFKPGRIIDDSTFYDGNRMSLNQIQSFINSKVPVCDTNGSQIYSGSTTRAQYGASRGYPAPYTCLKDYSQSVPGVSNSGSDLCTGSVSAGNKSAAQIIYDVARACSVNPQVLLVLLQKEQSLITDDWPWSIQYRSATGYGCPDTAPCDSEYYGFFNQVYQAAKAYKRYRANSANYNYRAGRNNTILWHPNTSCGSSNVYIENQATAGLYIYTPYRPNQAALNNLYGSGDSCSSYGNRNFWRMFNDWFGSTNQTILFKVSGSNTYYLEWGDYYYPIPSGEILTAYGLESIAPREVGSFPTGKTKGPALARAAQFGSSAGVVIVDGGTRHSTNASTLYRHGFSDWTTYDALLANLLPYGDDLAPIVRKPNGAIYLVENGKRRGFPDSDSYYNLSGPNAQGNTQIYAQQVLTNMSHDYVNALPDGAPMLQNGKFFSVSGSPAIFMHDNGNKYLFSANTFSAWGARVDYNFSQTSVDQIPGDDNAPLLVKAGTTNYLLNDGQKRAFTAPVLAAWGFVSDDFRTVSDDALARLGNGQNVTRLVTDHRPGIYYIDGGERHGIPSLNDFSRHGFSWGDITQISSQTLALLPRGADAYAPGAKVRTPNGAVFLIDENYVALGVTSSDLFYRYGLNWEGVAHVSSFGLSDFAYEPLQTLLYDSTTEKYYVVQGGTYHYIDGAGMDVAQYNFVSKPFNDVHPKFLQNLTAGRSLTRFLRGSGNTVYYIENGTKRPFRTEAAFFAKGGSWDKVIDVSDQFLAEFPRGDKL